MFKKPFQVFTKESGPTSEYLFADELKLEDEPSLNFISELVGGLIHKQNNQLAIVQGYSNLLSSLLLDEQMRENVFAIDKASSKLASLNVRVIDCIPGNLLASEPVNVLKVIKTIVDQIPDTPSMPKVEVENLFATPEVVIKANEEALTGVLSEIIQNSIQASASRVGADTIVVTLLDKAAGSPACIEVKDWGGGIPDDSLSSVFKPFFTTRQKQYCGIGLTRAAGLTHRMGGRLGVKCEEGRTSVLIQLPDAVS